MGATFGQNWHFIPVSSTTVPFIEGIVGLAALLASLYLIIKDSRQQNGFSAPRCVGPIKPSIQYPGGLAHPID